MKFLVFLIVNIVISLLCEKKSKVLTVCHAILFTVFFALTLFIGDAGLLSLGIQAIIGTEKFDFIYSALNSKVEMLGLNYSVIGLTELAMSLSILVAAVTLTIRFVIKVGKLDINKIRIRLYFSLKRIRCQILKTWERRYLTCIRLRI